jgi:four helix bundle protein
MVCRFWFVVYSFPIMATIQKFEDLEVWLTARSLCKEVYKLLAEPIFKNEFRLISQMKGSSGSIMDNIAEGFERNSRLEFINSLSISKGETGELKSQLYRCLDAELISKDVFEKLYVSADKITRMLSSFIQYLNNSAIKGNKFKNRSNG